MNMEAIFYVEIRIALMTTLLGRFFSTAVKGSIQYYTGIYVLEKKQ